MSVGKAFPPYEELDHTADLCLRVRGASLQEFFVHAAQGMFSLMRFVRIREGDPVRERFQLQAPDTETLLVDWLSELLFLSEEREALFQSFHFSELTPGRLEAVVEGRDGYLPQRGIKAVTFFDLRIQRSSDNVYEAMITFDV